MKADVILARIADGVNVTDKIILNDYFRGDKDVLHEDNLVDGLYIDSQRVIAVQASLQKGEVILWDTR